MSRIKTRSILLSCGLVALLLAGMLHGLDSWARGSSELPGSSSGEPALQAIYSQEAQAPVPGALALSSQEAQAPVPGASGLSSLAANWTRSTSLASSQPVTIHLPLLLGRYSSEPTNFGVQITNLSSIQTLSRAKEANVYWVRYHAFAWDKIEPVRTNPPTYNWAAVDEAGLQAAYAKGLTVIAIVQFTPSWAQKYPGSFCGPIRQDSLDEYAQFLTALVNRYKDAPYNIQYWEMGNEPDAPIADNRNIFGCWGLTHDWWYGGGTYGEMLRSAYPAIKAVDPSAQVLIGGLLLHSPNTEESRFFRGIVASGAGDSFDMVSFHAYPQYRPQHYDWEDVYGWPGGLVAGKVDYLRQTMAAYGLDKPLIQTEAGLICPAAYGCTPTESFLQAQAGYVPRLHTRNIALGLLGTVWYTLEGPGWENGGLLNADGSPKPAYTAYHFMTGKLGGAAYVGEASSAPGVRGYIFDTGRSLVQVLWSEDGTPREVSVPAAQLIGAWDKLGAPLSTGGDPVRLSISSPVYLEIRP